MRRDKSLARRPRTIILQTAPLLIVYGAIELIAGFSLSGMVGRLEQLPGILVLLPALLAMMGDIGEPFAAKVAAALHTGSIRTNKVSPDLIAVLSSSVVLTVVMSSVLGGLAWATCSLSGAACLSGMQFVSIAFITGILSGAVLLAVGVAAAFYSFGRGVDPDDVVTPTVGSIGDVVTVLVFVATFSWFV